ncbi:MAG: site-specific integrase [Fusobacterium necrophorum]|nr:site-specific integrase [Fusobacterium necrophorum]
MPIYKDKKTGKYYITFYYTDYDGVRKRKKKEGFDRKKDAEEYKNSFLEKVTSNPSMIFSSFLHLYLEDSLANVRYSTYKTKEYLIKAHILPFFENFNIHEIDALSIRKWQNSLKIKGYKDTYLRTINNQLSAIFNYAERFYNLKDNPVKKLSKMGKKHANEMNFWTLEEFEIFVNAIEDDFTLYTIVNILFYTGIRKGELLALTSKSFNFQKKEMYITESYQRIDGRDLITKPKTEKSIRTIALPEFLCEIIEEYINKLYDYRPHERLFYLNKYSLLKKINTIISKHNLKQIRIHDFRHSHVALLISMNINILEIADRLGHENPQTTLRTYGHLYPDKQ